MERRGVNLYVIMGGHSFGLACTGRGIDRFMSSSSFLCFFMGYSLFYLILEGPVPRLTVTPNPIDVSHSFTAPHSLYPSSYLYLHPPNFPSRSFSNLYHARPVPRAPSASRSNSTICMLSYLCHFPCCSHPRIAPPAHPQPFPRGFIRSSISFYPRYLLHPSLHQILYLHLFLTLFPFTPHLHHTSLHELITHPFIHTLALCPCIRSSSRATLP